MSRPIRRLGLFGVAGVNRGDDAISHCLLEGFRALRPELRFIVPEIRQGTLPAREGVETFFLERRSPAGLLRLARNVAKVDAVVLGGGSIVQDQFGGTRLTGIIGYGWMVAMLCRLLGRPLVTAPIGVDELQTQAGRKAARELLAVPRLLAVRDTLSANMAKGLLPDADVTVTCDPVFGWEEGAGEPKRNRVVLSPAYEGKNEAVITALFAAVARRVLEGDAALELCIIAMDDRAQEDGGKIAQIRDALPAALQGRVELAVPATAQEAARILRSARSVVAMRLHSLILGYGFARLYCFSRTTKTDGLMEAYAIDGMRMPQPDGVEQAAEAAAHAIAQGDVAAHAAQRARLRQQLAGYYAAAWAALERARS